STNASLHTTGGVSPPTSLPACDRRPAACRLRGHICPCRHTTAGPSRGRASAALRPPPRGRKGRGTLGNAKQVAGSMGPVEEGPMDAPTDPKYQSVDREEARRAELPPHAALDGHGFFKHHSRRYDYNQSAQCPVCPSSIENAEHVFYHCPRFSEERERLHSLLYEVMTPEKHHQAHAREVIASGWHRGPSICLALGWLRCSTGSRVLGRRCLLIKLVYPAGWGASRRRQRRSRRRRSPPPSLSAAEATRRILGAPLRCKEKDARLPTPAEFASGAQEDMMMRLDELVQGLGKFLSDKSNIHKEIFCYQACLGMAVTALRDSLERQGPSGPPTADKETSTPPIFAGRANGKRAAVSPPALRAVTKRSNGVAAPTQPDTINNNDAGDQDEFVLVESRRNSKRKQLPQQAEAARPNLAHQSSKARLLHRRVHHRPDAIVIKTNGSTSYADILKTLKGEASLQQTVGSSVHNIRRSASGALVLQLKKGEKTYLLSVQRSRRCSAPWRLPALASTLPRSKSRTSTSASTRRRSPRHWAHYWASQSPKPTTRCRPWSQVHEPDLPSCPEDIPSPPMMRILQLNLNHCEAAQDLLSQTMREQLINVAIVCDQYKNLDPPYTWLADANNQAAIWVHGGTIVQERPAGAHAFFTWARISGIYFFSVYAPPRLADVEFSALLTNIVEEAQGKRPLIVAGDFNAWSTEWGCRETRLRATTLLDALAPSTQYCSTPVTLQLSPVHRAPRWLTSPLPPTHLPPALHHGQ
ncbi:unnamed protein product, partial [Trichogramma brassicae]